MEKQSLIKYYCALFLALVLLAGSNHAVAQTSPTIIPTDKAPMTASPVTTQSGGKLKAESNNSMLFPIVLSILALAASGGAIALTILKNKEIDRNIDFLKKKYNDELKSLENKYNELSTSQVASQSNQPHEAISRNSTTYNNPNAFLESSIDDLLLRITKLENKLKVTQINQQSIISSKPTYLSNQSRNQEPDFNPFNQVNGLSQSNTTQPLENLAYFELVNTYNTNPKLLEQAAIKVSEPTDSINRRHSDSSQKIVLEKATNSNYWVIRDQIGVDCWLLPKSKLRIDQFRYETTKALFECHGYHPEYSTFKLVKPAKVIPLSADEQTWQLEEPGILEFSVEA